MADDPILKAIQGGAAGAVVADDEEDPILAAINKPAKAAPIGPPPTFQNLYQQPQVAAATPAQQAEQVPTTPNLPLAPPQNPPLQTVDATKVPVNVFTNKYMPPPAPPPAPQVSQDELAKQIMESNTPGALGAQAAQGVNVADLPTSQAAGEQFAADVNSGSKKLPLPYLATNGQGLKTMSVGELEKLSNDYLNDPSVPKSRGEAFAAGVGADTIQTLNDIFLSPVGLASGGVASISARALANAGKEGTAALKLAAEYQAMKKAGATAEELLQQEQKIKASVAAAGESQKTVVAARVAGQAAGGGFAAQGGFQVIDGIKNKDPRQILSGLAGIALGSSGVLDSRGANVSEGVKAETARMATEEFKKQGPVTAKRTPQATENATVPPEQPKLEGGTPEGHIGPKEEPLAPESPQTLKAQTDALAAGTNKVVYFPKGTDNVPAPPENSVVTVVPGDKAGAGTYYHTPDVTPELIKKRVADGTFGQLLGNTQGKAEAIASGKPTAVIARDESGHEVKSSLADSTNPQAVAEQAAVLARQFPNAKIGVEAPEKVVSERLGIPATAPTSAPQTAVSSETPATEKPTDKILDAIKGETPTAAPQYAPPKDALGKKMYDEALHTRASLNEFLPPEKRVPVPEIPREAPTAKPKVPREKVQPLEEKYSPETLTVAREEMKQADAIRSADRDRMYGVGSARHIVGQQYPWYDRIKAGPQKLAEIAKKGTGAAHDRILDDIAKGIEQRKSDAKAAVAGREEELRAAAAQVRAIDPALADELEGLAEGRYYDVQQFKDFVDRKIHDSKTAADFNKIFEDYDAEAATESAADRESTDLREPGGDEHDGEETARDNAFSELNQSLQRQAPEPREAENQTRNQLKTLPGFHKVVAEEKAAAGKVQAEKLTEKINTPENIDRAAAEMESKSPLFRGTEASPQREIFGLPRTAPGSTIPEKEPSDVKPLGTTGEGALEATPSEDVRGSADEREFGLARGESRAANAPGISGRNNEGNAPAGQLGSGEAESHLSSGRGDATEPGRIHGQFTGSNQSGNDYRITEADKIGEGGPKQKYAQNAEAIRLLNAIESEGRTATPAEQSTLIKYSGWGWTGNDLFNEDKAAWSKERKELKSLLTDAEYAAARASTTNAHYTSPQVVEAVWAAVRRLGFTGGRMLEPSAGIGHFLGLMPSDLSVNTKKTAIELDPISGRILKQLYQNADVRIHGFEQFNPSNGTFDLAISNVPFGDYKLHDPAYNKLNLSIHNYFITKMLDKVRPGGLAAIITSHHTLDNTDSSVRKHFADRADLLGAIRLPDTAFQKNAGTEVTTDMLFFRKRGESEKPRGETFSKLAEVKPGIKVNEYYNEHPDMALGEHALTGTMYGKNSYTLEAGKEPITMPLLKALMNLPEGAMSQHEAPESTAQEAMAAAIPDFGEVKQSGLAVRDGKVFRRTVDGIKQVEDFPKKLVQSLKGMLQIRDAVRELFQEEAKGADPAELTDLRSRLNRFYDSFVSKHGKLHEIANRNAMYQDPDLPLVLSLEKYNPKTKASSKSDVFFKQTIAPRKPVERVETPKEALQVSLAERGNLNFERMAQLTGITPEDLQSELRAQGLVFHSPEGHWETADQYLSGNVRKKFAEAQKAAAKEPEFKANAEALQKVIPADLEPGLIGRRLGSSWIPENDVKDFIDQKILEQENYRSGTRVTHIQSEALWTVVSPGGKYNANSTTKWGTPRVNAVDLIEMALNAKQPTVRNAIPGTDPTQYVVDQNATLAARDKLEKIEEEFSKWLFGEPKRAERLARYYNDTFNANVERVFDGSHLTFPGMTAERSLRGVQKNMVWRAISGGNESAYHQVGLGKTYEAIAIAMEKRRLGLAKKPLITVPNHMVEQWAADWRQLYPGANVLAITKEDFKSDRRKEFVSRIATGDWDGVLMAHSSFGKVPTTLDTYKRVVDEQLAMIEENIRKVSKGEGKKGPTVKNLEKIKRRLEAKFAERAKRETKDDSLHFEELGVDALIVDEAHEFKNLLFHTKMGQIAGISNSDAERAFDMSMKVHHVSKLNNGKNVHFLTGTPISNTMAELYTMMRYLDPQRLKDMGVEHFDSWAATFGKVTQNWEVSPSDPSRMRVSARFNRFENLPELINSFRNTGDVKYTNEVEGLVRPDVKGGKSNVVDVPASARVAAYVKDLGRRADALKGFEEVKNPVTGKIERKNVPKPEPTEDNPLKITGDGRKAALDFRIVDPTAPDEPGSKLNAAVDNIHKIWKETTDTRRTQVVFLDMGTPPTGNRKAAGAFNAYQDIKNKLIARGVPKDEIAFIHDAKKDEQKQALFNKVNGGEVRIILGSTQKMGVGTNIQQRLIALHHVDAPWRPSDIEQREGRIIRQGNENKEVQVHTYVTKGSFDAYLWQLIENKAKFIHQAMKNEAGARSAEDVDGRSLSAGEIKALATGNPQIAEKMKTDMEVGKLQRLLGEHQNEQTTNRVKLAAIPDKISTVEDQIKAIRDDAKTVAANATKGDEFKITVAKGQYTERIDAGQAINGSVEKNKGSDPRKIGKFAGLDMWTDGNGNPYLMGEARHYFSTNHENPAGTVQSMEATIRYLDKRVGEREKSIADLQLEQRQRTETLDQPFEKQKELDALLRKQKELDASLKVNEEDGSAAAAPKNVEFDEDGKVVKPEKKPRNDDEAGFGSIDALLFGIPSLIGKAIRALTGGSKPAPAVPEKPKPIATPPQSGIPKTVPTKERAGNIRLDKLNAPEDVINEIRRMAKERGPELDEQRRGKQTFGQTRTAAEKLVEEGMFTEGDLKHMKAGSALNAEELLAARGMLIEQGRMVRVAAKMAAEHPTTDNYLRFQQELQKHAGIQKAVSGAVAEAGRALSQQRMIANALKREDRSNHERVLEALGGQELSEEAARRLAQIPENDPVALNNFLRSQKNWTTIQKIESYWITNVLSSPRTPIKKGFGDVTLALLEGGNKAVEGAIDPILAMITGRQREVFMREAPAFSIAAISAIPEGIRKAAFILSHGFDQDTALNLEMPYRYEFPGGGKNPFNYPGRALQGVTKFFQVMAFQGELHAQAVRQALKEGLRGNAMQNRAAELVQHPTDRMVEASMNQAHLQTFTENADTLSRILTTMRDKVQIPATFPLIGGLRPMKFIIPFIQIPYNLTKHAFRYSPFSLPRLSDPGVWRDKKASGILSRALIGSALMALFAYLAAKNGLTGAAPSAPAERDEFYRSGKQPFSMKIGGKWVSYKILGPLALNAAAVSGWHDRMEKTGDQPLPDQVIAAIAAMGEALLQESFLAGMKNLVDALSDPSHAASRFATGIVGGFVPFESALRTTNDALDPTVRNPNGMYERIVAGLPVVSKSVPPKLDALGRPSVKEGSGGIAAIFPGGFANAAPRSSVDGELDRLKDLGLRNIGFVGKTITVDNVKINLTREERDASQKMRGQYIRAYLAKLFASEPYKAMTDEDKLQETQSAIREAERDSHEETIDAVLNKRLKRTASIPRTAPTASPAQ